MTREHLTTWKHEDGVLVAAPTYRGKDYAFERYMAAYEAFTWPERSLLLVDNTRGDEGAYVARLAEAGVPKIAHVDPTYDFEETFTLCWKEILRVAQVEGWKFVLALETDVIGPPMLLDALLNIAGYCHAPFVTVTYPYHDGRFKEYYQGLGCLLMTTQLLEAAMKKCEETDTPWSGLIEGAVYETGKHHTHVSLHEYPGLHLEHLDHPGGHGNVPEEWDFDPITDPRVVLV
jgi:hypothetical protein